VHTTGVASPASRRPARPARVRPARPAWLPASLKSSVGYPPSLHGCRGDHAADRSL